MATIQEKSIQSTAIILVGFSIGAINMLILQPKLLTTEQFGLTRVITDAGLTLATLCTLGCLPVIYKFYPFYTSYLKKRQNDLPFITGLICLAGLVIMSLTGWLCRDIIIRKFSEKSPLFVQYSYLVYPYCFFMLCFMWLESFAVSLRKSLVANGLRELLPRIFFTVLLLFLGYQTISEKEFYALFSVSFLLPAITIYMVLRRTKNFEFVSQLSPVTIRLGYKMTNFALFIFGAQFLNLLSRTVDTFILTAKSDRGLTDTAIFTIATYIVTLMEVPQRSMNSVSTPILAEAWKNKDLPYIRRIYKKSVTNLLVIGLVMFGLIWLNLHNIAGFLGKNFTGVESVILYMGMGKLIDLGTGANSQIIGTSSFWKVDFITNFIYTLVALPLNYFLISKYGLMGAAYSTLISLSFYNAMRFGFLRFKFGMQPYTYKDLVVIIITVISVAASNYIPRNSNFIVDTLFRSSLFVLIFTPLLYSFRISEEINGLFEKKLPFLFGRKGK
jgi:O-antigen/teichoic acid export membrane protein